MRELLLRKWLLDKGYRVTQIAVEVGVSHTLVCHTIQGKAWNHRVMNWFLAKGCPGELLPAKIGG